MFYTHVNAQCSYLLTILATVDVKWQNSYNFKVRDKHPHGRTFSIGKFPSKNNGCLYEQNQAGSIQSF